MNYKQGLTRQSQDVVIKTKTRVSSLSAADLYLMKKYFIINYSSLTIRQDLLLTIILTDAIT